MPVAARPAPPRPFDVAPATASQAAELAAWPATAAVRRCGDCGAYAGVFRLPRRGERVRFDAANAPALAALIRRYEGRRAELRGGGVWVDGVPAASYVFAEDYYFVAGDNRAGSRDSRTWGAVPGRLVTGKALLVYFSWDPVREAPRWGRVLKRIGRGEGPQVPRPAVGGSRARRWDATSGGAGFDPNL